MKPNLTRWDFMNKLYKHSGIKNLFHGLRFITLPFRYLSNLYEDVVQHWGLLKKNILLLMRCEGFVIQSKKHTNCYEFLTN